MIAQLIRWSLGSRLTVVALALAIAIWGAFVAARMPVDVFPDLTAPTVTVVAEGHGLSPLEMETQVTLPIESALNGASGVRRVRSGTAVGIAVVWVEFEWGADILRARQMVAERIGALAGSLPPQVEAPKLAPMSSIMGEIVFASLTSDRHDGIALRSAATTLVRRRLLAVPGVSQVTPIGGDVMQLEAVLSPELLRGYGIGAHEVVEALARANENVAGGVLNEGARELLVEGIGRVRTGADVAATQVTVRNGVPITVADLGEVRVGSPLKRGEGSASRRLHDGTPVTERAVILAIQKQPGANTLELTARLDGVFEELQASLPEGMTLNAQLFRQATFIENSIRNSTSALLEGAAIVVLVVLAFLANARASLITLVALPVSLLATVLALHATGSNINTMTLGGMAIAIGALVDDAIIDVENVVRRLRENFALSQAQRRPPGAVIFDASVEVRSSIVLATLIILLVFVPLFFLSGVEGRLLQPLGVAFSVSLAASLLTAVTLTPALCALLLPRSTAITRAGRPFVERALLRAYDAPLEWSLRRPWALAIPGAALSAASIAVALSLGRSFLPEFNEGALVVGVVTTPGASLAESDALARLVEESLMKHPEIVAIGRRTGRAEEDEHVQGVEASEIDLTLDMDAPLKLGLARRTKAELLDALRAEVAAVPGVKATFGQPIGHRIDHMLSGTRANLAVKLYGDDLEQLRVLAMQAESLMRDVPGVVDLSIEQQVLVPTVRIEFDRAALARNGLQVADAAQALELATTGQVAGRVLERTRAYDLVVRVGEVDSLASGDVAGILVAHPGGARIPLSELASVREDRTPNFIARENAQRRIAVTCNVSGGDLDGVVAQVRARLEQGLSLPPSYFVEYGGQFESAAGTTRRLLVLSALIVVAIAFLLYATFRSARDVALVMLNLPLALVGGVFGVWISDEVLSVATLIGFITVFGIAARNGIMIVAHVRHLERFEGVRDFREAVRRGARERLSPILMTALASGLALVPLALRGDAPGSEILTPMAIVILFGLLSSTLLNMFLLPTLLLRFARPLEFENHEGVATEAAHALV